MKQTYKKKAAPEVRWFQVHFFGVEPMKSAKNNETKFPKYHKYLLLIHNINN